MKRLFCSDLVDGATLALGVSNEERCAGIASRMEGAMPCSVVIFDYGGDGGNDALAFAKSALGRSANRPPTVVDCTVADPVDRIRRQIDAIYTALHSDGAPLALDFSVIPRGDLWMLLRWLNDAMLWDRTSLFYTEPEVYSTVKGLPLSSGLRRIETLPGEAGLADCSRPLHVLIQLGYEGDQALAVYEETQPAKTTLLIPDPPFRPAWVGRTESFNAELIGLVGESACQRVDAVDPAGTVSAVMDIVTVNSGEESMMVCPLGTKPQLVGLFAAVRKMPEQPAVLIPTPLRAASTARPRGVGISWAIGWEH